MAHQIEAFGFYSQSFGQELKPGECIAAEEKRVSGHNTPSAKISSVKNITNAPYFFLTFC